MKKNIKVFSCTMLISLMFITSCSNQIINYNSDDVSASENLNVEDYNQLSKPTNLSFNSSTNEIKWNAIDGATYYDININGKTIKSNLKDTSYFLEEEDLKDMESALISVRGKTSSSTSAITSKYSSILYTIGSVMGDSVLEVSLNDDESSVSIIGLASFATSQDVAELTIDTKINNLPVTKIASSAFASSKLIGKVIIPEGVLEIEDSAFESSSLKEITLPSTLVKIGNKAFKSTKLTKLVIPSSIQEIGENCFESSSTITTLTFEEGCQLKNIPASSFASLSNIKTLEIPESIETIGDNAFYKCTRLTTITFKGVSKLKSIGASAFESCTNYKDITIPASVEIIGNEAFKGSNGLTYFMFEANSSISTIGDSAFETCKKLSYFGTKTDNIPENEIILLKSITTIGSKAFAASKFEKFQCEDDSSLKIIGESAFKGSSLKSIIFPESIEDLGSSAFEGCSALETVSIPETAVIQSVDQTTFASTPFFTTYGDGTIVMNHVLIKVSDSDLSKTTYNVQEGIKTIANGVFKGNKTLQSIQLPSSLLAIGDNTFEKCSALTSITIPNNVTSIGDYAFSEASAIRSIALSGNALKTIGKYAFYKIDSKTATDNTLSTITLPNSVEIVGDYAFANNVNLLSITFSEGSHLKNIGEYCFYSDNKLSSITFPSSIEIIGKYAFSTSSSSNALTSVEFAPNAKITTIEASTFEKCKSLTSVILPSSLKNIGENAFKNASELSKISIGDQIETIENSAFESCSKLSDVQLKTTSQLQAIGDKAFYKTAIEEILLPSTLNKLGVSAFEGCAKLKSITFGDGAFSISENAVIKTKTFASCTSLTSITLPDAVTAIEELAFANCSALNEVNTKTNSISVDAFKDSLIETSAYNGEVIINNVLIKYLGEDKNVILSSNIKVVNENVFKDSSITSIKLPSSIEKISSGAFLNCKSLKSVMIDEDNQLITIEESAFENCFALASFNMGMSKIESIGSHAFANCNALESVTLPDTLVSIDSYAFYQTGLKSVTIPNQVTSIGEYAFANCGKAENVEIDSKLWNIQYHLEEVNFANATSLKEIGKYAFAYMLDDMIDLSHCEDLSLDAYCFANSYNLKEFSMKDSFTASTGVLYGCSSLEKMTIPGSISGLMLFDGKTESIPSTLKTIEITQGSTTICAQSFSGFGSVTQIILPESIKTIEKNAFYGCNKLTSINLIHVDSIGENAFIGCTSLENITLNNQITYIGNKAFMTTKWLNNQDDTFVVVNGILIKYNGTAENVTLNDSITCVAGGAFAGNQSIKKITLNENTVKLCNGAFDNCGNLSTIVVKCDSVIEIELEIFDSLSSTFKVDVAKTSDYANNIYWSLYSDLLK